MSPAAAILVGLAALAVALVGLSMYRNPILRRISVRNRLSFTYAVAGMRLDAISRRRVAKS